ncbi:TBC1 domain family member 1 [Armadillidium nasatum]|uniref:TBC1 domain family member 1 n=1 Tax=Armadillidium nasatum TaxID=96803 RepID=A0A5N5TIY4_9CRUS|nr:TBC1 domain family member 1 [Armadillidium nasatum]
MISFQQEGSGYSVPNIVLRNLCGDEASPTMSKIENKDFVSGECTTKKDSKACKVRFHLGDSCDIEDKSAEESPRGSFSLSPQSSVSSTSSYPIHQVLRELEEEEEEGRGDTFSSRQQQLLKGSPEIEAAESSNNLRNALKKLSVSANSELPGCENNSSVGVGQLLSIESVEPFDVQRQRSISTCDRNQIESVHQQQNDVVTRTRSGSIGSILSRNRSLRPSEADLRALGYDFNRTMLFHIGHREVQLINPELKSVQLHKPFKDIAGCCQGMKANDHFGFICREITGDKMVYVGYIFRCDKSSVSDEIMQVLNRAFSAMHEAHQRERKEHLMCDFCPLKWFSHLCAEVEGLPAAKAHSVIMKRVFALPEEDREIIVAKYEGAETSELAQKNNVLMMLLQETPCWGPNLESSLKKAHKRIATSFNHLLKKREESIEKESPKPLEETSRVSPTRASSLDKAPSQSGSGNSCVLEGISDSPLKPYRQRSSTVSGAGGDSMRKELIAKKAKKQLETEKNIETKSNEVQRNSGPKMNIFLKFGSLSFHDDSQDKDVYDNSKPLVSFRQSILQKVVSPAKGMSGEYETTRKISTGALGKPELQKPPKRCIEDLMMLWRKSVFQQILLLRVERENQRLRALQKEAALQKVRLNYEEEELPVEAQQAWELMLSRPHARIDSNVLFSGIKQGVPKLVRGEVWHLLMIQQQMFHQTPRQKNVYPPFFQTQYEDMLKELTSQQHAILIDLGRTFPGHPYFTQTLGPGQLALFNILKAYSILDSDVGYCQGLSFVGGVLLLHVEEEEAYQLLKYLMFDKGCRKQYRPDLDGLQIRMYQLTRLVHEKLHDLYEHLEKHEVTPQLYAAPWFLTLFASQFPLNFVSRVFDLLFLIGMEAVFCVALVLLQTHEQILLSLDSFEQIMDYFKNTLPDMQTNQLNSFFAEVCECNVKKELSTYEVEYQVLQEESFFSPQQNANLQKLKESCKNLKRQNLDLLEDLHSAKLRQQNLESSNQSLQQNQHHLEVRVRWLEMERSNMRRLIEILCKNTSKDTFEQVPANLERYLPHKASTPMHDDRRIPSRDFSPEMRRHSPNRQVLEEEESLLKEISIQVPRQHSHSPVRNVENECVDYAPRTYNPTRRSRSSTLDPKAMQNYFKNFIKSE